MSSAIKYFILNRPSDWEDKGIIDNLLFKGESLASDNRNGNNGVYITTSFDSFQDENIWHRLRLEYKIPQNALLRLKIYASDSLYTLVPGKTQFGDPEISMDEYLMDTEVKIDEKIKLFEYLGAKEFTNPNDLVLFEFKGRYLWICMEVINYNEDITEISKLKLEISGTSLADYLPQIYRGIDRTSFLHRFLFIFQSLYADLNDEIDDLPRLFAPDRVDEEFLNWVVKWFSIKDTYIWGEEKLRLLLKNIIELYKIKGTKESIKKIVELYLGITPLIVERFEVTDNDCYKNAKEHIDNLFGNNGFTFSVIINTDKKISSDVYAELMRIINRFKPIDTICNLVILNNEIYLDYHCYLGIISYVAGNEKIILDENDSSSTQLLLVNSDKI